MRHSDSTIRVSKVASQSYWQKPPSPKWMHFTASANSLPAEVKLIDHASTLDTGYESADILWDHNALCAVRCARRMSMARKSLLTRAVYWALSTPGNTSSTKVDKRKRWLYAEWSLSKKNVTFPRRRPWAKVSSNFNIGFSRFNIGFSMLQEMFLHSIF